VTEAPECWTGAQLTFAFPSVTLHPSETGTQGVEAQEHLDASIPVPGPEDQTKKETQIAFHK